MKDLPHPSIAVEIGLTAAIVAVRGDTPLILVARGADGRDLRGAGAALPSGPFDPLHHRTFEMGLRAWVAEQTGVPVGYVEQLYTFGDRGRQSRAGSRDPHEVSVGYLALTRLLREDLATAPGAGFREWYRFFPWEDWRNGRPALIDSTIMPGLRAFVERGRDAGASTHRRGLTRIERMRQLFGEEGDRFDEDNVLDRYELLYEAGLVEESARDGREPAPGVANWPPLGESMQADHRRILATAMGRLRAKMKYRPVIFELMPESFTLTALQTTVEAISGRHLHKQNFRRLVEAAAVVEATGEMSHATGGRPAALFRFRREVLQERPSPGLRVGIRG
ncbi:NAD regulator [uncultured Rhodoblastus sp.]|uniref:NUDIX hydrolase n=1 Tax=uncultured Rhodoblastus sp. TaxID=543037 RepID=UPI0025F5B180|nr:NAD regulator [uncultured Rhodoblastus sp.]